MGVKSSGLLETKEARQYPVEFRGPERDADTFEISLPSGYEVNDLPPPADVDFSFGSYHSKTEVKGNELLYTRTYEIKELSVPVSKTEDLKKFYRIIAGDERVRRCSRLWCTGKFQPGANQRRQTKVMAAGGRRASQRWRSPRGAASSIEARSCWERS